MGYVGRFAPSPTGPLHFGSLIAALASYLDAKAHGGKWLVRIEDIDETRCDASHTAEILRTLQALGLSWDGDVEVQTTRKAIYGTALERLRVSGFVYACTCSRREIADSGIAGLEGPVYPETCRDRLLAEHGNAMRVRTDGGPVAFTDLVQGRIEQDVGKEIGDFVVKRRDGMFAYQLAVVVDDAEQGVTHVVRGADLLESTARQIYLQRFLGYATPEYLHIPVAVNEMGQKLSKQTLAPSLATASPALRGLCMAALGFLGQSVDIDPDLPNRDFLATATRSWDRSRIPVAHALLFMGFS